MANTPTILPVRRFSFPGNKKNDSLLARLSGLLVHRRYLRVTFAALLCFSLTWLFWPSQLIEELNLWAFPIVMPPLYERYHHFERNLPQLDLSLPAPDGKHAKYFWARNHVHESGWGNVMQELLLNSHLAYKSGRAFVFPNYTWEHTGLNYTTFNNKTIPNYIPMTTMIIGPTVGGPWPPGINTSRAVTKEWFNTICPNPTVLSTETVIKDPMEDLGADVLIDRWVEKLKSIDDVCLELDWASSQIFSIWVFGSTRILPAWPQLFESPVITQFGWSDMIISAFETNIHFFLDDTFSYYSFPVVIPSFPIFPSHSQSAPLPGLLALHIRQGDFSKHCDHFAEYSSSWNGFNLFPELPDKFVFPPPAKGSGMTVEEATYATYRKMCFPSIEQIVDKVMQIKATPAGSTLDKIYVMTNADREWIRSLKRALKAKAAWKNVASSRDMVLTRDQRYVAQAVDMFIGQRAQVFIGNGFSSLTSNVVMLRMARQFPPESSRFWS